MNHYYTHCGDYNPDICPRDCFRAKLTKEYNERCADFEGIPVTWANLRKTDVCPLNAPKRTNGDRIRAMTDEELAEWIVQRTTRYGFDGYEDEVKYWLGWLKQPAESEEMI